MAIERCPSLSKPMIPAQGHGKARSDIELCHVASKHCLIHGQDAILRFHDTRQNFYLRNLQLGQIGKFRWLLRGKAVRSSREGLGREGAEPPLLFALTPGTRAQDLHSAAWPYSCRRIVVTRHAISEAVIPFQLTRATYQTRV